MPNKRTTATAAVLGAAIVGSLVIPAADKTTSTPEVDETTSTPEVDETTSIRWRDEQASVNGYRLAINYDGATPRNFIDMGKPHADEDGVRAFEFETALLEEATSVQLVAYKNRFWARRPSNSELRLITVPGFGLQSELSEPLFLQPRQYEVITFAATDLKSWEEFTRVTVESNEPKLFFKTVIEKK